MMYIMANYDYNASSPIFGFYTGYGFINLEKYKGKIIGEFEHAGVRWWVRKNEGMFTATDFNSHSALARHFSLEGLNKEVCHRLDTCRIMFEANSSRVKHGQEGVRLEPKDLIIYGNFK